MGYFVENFNFLLYLCEKNKQSLPKWSILHKIKAENHRPSRQIMARFPIPAFFKNTTYPFCCQTYTKKRVRSIALDFIKTESTFFPFVFLCDNSFVNLGCVRNFFVCLKISRFICIVFKNNICLGILKVTKTY